MTDGFPQLKQESDNHVIADFTHRRTIDNSYFPTCSLVN